MATAQPGLRAPGAPQNAGGVTATVSASVASSASRLQGARVLVVDDEESNRTVLRSFLERWGCTNVECVGDVDAALQVTEATAPDLILLDLHLPGRDGFDFLEGLDFMGAAKPPVLVLTADNTHATRRRALAAGAKDFVTKPFDPSEVQLRAGNLLEVRALHREMEAQQRRLEFLVSMRTEEVAQTRQEVLDRLALAAEYRDDETKEHPQRVGRNTGIVAAALGLPKNQVTDIARAAPLHDLGKVGIPDKILLKQGKLTDEEFETVKSHTFIGAQILGGSPYAVLEVAAEIALAHHERFDGTGYPRRLKGTDIPLGARLVSVVDVFDTLVHERAWRTAWSVEQAIDELRAQAGRQFDPDIVETFIRLVEHDRITM